MLKMEDVYLHTNYIVAVVYHYEYRAPKCSNWQIVICGSWVQLLIIGITLSSLRNLSFGAIYSDLDLPRVMGFELVF